MLSYLEYVFHLFPLPAVTFILFLPQRPGPSRLVSSTPQLAWDVPVFFFPLFLSLVCVSGVGCKTRFYTSTGWPGTHCMYPRLAMSMQLTPCFSSQVLSRHLWLLSCV